MSDYKNDVEVSEDIKESKSDWGSDEALNDGIDTEAVSNLLKITSDKFTRVQKVIKISDIGYGEPMKIGRRKTLTGLTRSIKELGVVTPIHVKAVSDEDAEDGYRYVLIDGMRRIFGALKSGMTEIDAIVWTFEDDDLSMDFLLILSLMVNRTQRKRWSEIWDLYQIIEMQHNVSPGTLEYLLQLQGGDAMKLKDVMMCEYSEVKEVLMNGEKDLDGSYRLLQKLRKEEDQLARDDAMGISDTAEDAEDLASSLEQGTQLSDDDVLELLEMADGVDELNVDEEDFDTLNVPSEIEHQKSGERHPVDKVIKDGTFQRDNFRCRCCNTGGVAFLGTLIYHHVIPVADGGPDTVDNGLTLCDSCHQILHIIQKNRGYIAMTKSQFDEYDEVEQRRIKLILKYARIAVEADKRRGRSKKEIVADATASARHRMPGETYKETKGMYTSAKVKQYENEIEQEVRAGGYNL